MISPISKSSSGSGVESFDIVFPDLDFLLQLEHLVKLPTTLAGLKDCWDDKAIELAILLSFAFSVGERGGRGGVG